MPKGRSFAPETQRDGVWFAHRGMGPYQWPPQRDPNTSTGEMLTAPFKEFTAAYPPKPPKDYDSKHIDKNFKTSNKFSNHDNRHSFQDHGVYLGDGGNTRNLGKRLQSADNRLHFTDKDQLKHYGREVTNYDYNSSYASNFRGKATDEAPERRRFPKVHAERSMSGSYNRHNVTSTTKWFKEPEVPHNTHLQVLASSQEPFLPHNSWKYSNHGLAKCYPPFDTVDHAKPFSTWLINGPVKDSGTKQAA